MKIQIAFKKTDGSEGVALVEGSATSLAQAKRDLAAKLDLPDIAGREGEHEDIDARLRLADIDPASITFNHVAE